MKTTLLAGTAVAFSLLSSALADETEQPTEAAAREAAGVWYGVYTHYVDRGFLLARAGTKFRRMGALATARQGTSEPIFVVLDLQLRDDAVQGTMKTGVGVRFEDPEAAMKRLFDIPLAEPTLPEDRAVEGTWEGEQLSFSVLPSGTEPVVEVTAEVDAGRMRATMQYAPDDVRNVRLDRCDPASAEGQENADGGTAEDVSFCSLESIWRRLAEEQGLPVNPSQSSSRGSRRR